MKDLRIIINLEDYLQENPGIHPIVTGTFDPAHIQHTAPVVMSYEELQENGITNPYIILPHSRNNNKKPVATLRERQRWILETFDYFAGQIAHRIKLCIDMAEPKDPYIYDLPPELQDRLIRIAGGDKNGEITQGRIQTKFVARDIDVSSSLVREFMRQTKSHPTLKAVLAPKVYEEIVALGYYR